MALNSPVVPYLQPWEDCPFPRCIMGWPALAQYIAASANPPHRSTNAVRLLFWSGGMPGVKALRTSQTVLFCRDSVDTYLKQGGLQDRRGRSTQRTAAGRDRRNLCDPEKLRSSENCGAVPGEVRPSQGQRDV